MMLADDLADRAQLLRFEEVGPDPPDDLAVAADDRHEAGLAAADDDVARREPPVAFVEPVVRTDIRRRVDVEPVEAVAAGIGPTAPSRIRGRRGLDGRAGCRGESELL